ncbi:hypothetical protein [Ekhidna sp.]|uniref:hypothetical protein n=1 Tax=Ekhidna sp. TaxID=2608089 RepID=UPI0032EE6CFA
MHSNKKVEISGTRLSLISDSLVEELMDVIRMIKSDLKSLRDLVTFRVTINDLECVGYNEVGDILKFGRTKVEQLVADGVLTKVNINGHARFNVMQLAVDLGIPFQELKQKIQEVQSKY